MAQESEWPVRLVSAKVVVENGTRYLHAELEVDRGTESNSFRFPAQIPYHGLDDSSIVPVARNYFARSMRKLADQTADWEISPEELAALLPDRETR